MPGKTALFSILWEENPGHQKTHDAGKQEGNTPDAEQQRNKGLSGFRLPLGAEHEIRSQMVVDIKGPDKNDQGQNKANQG